MNDQEMIEPICTCPNCKGGYRIGCGETVLIGDTHETWCAKCFYKVEESMSINDDRWELEA